MTICHAIKLLGLIGTVTFCFSSLHSPDLMLHFSHFYLRLFLCGWNSIPCTGANKLEHFQRKFLRLCHRLLLNHLHCKCTNVLDINWHFISYMLGDTAWRRFVLLLAKTEWNSALPVKKRFGFVCPLETSEIWPCLMLILNVATFSLPASAANDICGNFSIFKGSLFCLISCHISRLRWPRGLKCGSSAAHYLELRVRIPLGTWISVCYECCVFR
jgi:hypothetical protein